MHSGGRLLVFVGEVMLLAIAAAYGKMYVKSILCQFLKHVHNQKDRSIHLLVPFLKHFFLNIDRK